MNHRTVFTAVAMALAAATAESAPLSTFDTGFDGWAAFEETDPNIDLDLADFDTDGAELEYLGFGGNDGGYVRVSDSAPQGGSLPIQAPGAFLGDLTGFSGIAFDQIIFPTSNLNGGLSVFLVGADGTRYSKRADTDAPFSPPQWESVALDFGEFVRAEGSAPLDTVLSDVRYLLIGLDVSTNTNGLEGGVDNVTLVPAAIPLPAAPVLLVTGLAGLALLRRRG